MFVWHFFLVTTKTYCHPNLEGSLRTDEQSHFSVEVLWYGVWLIT